MKQTNLDTTPLFSTVQLGPYTLKNRIVMPPLTRSRSTQSGDIPNDLMANYYEQRATAGFMVTEGTQIEPRGQGYAWTIRTNWRGHYAAEPAQSGKSRERQRGRIVFATGSGRKCP